MTWKLFNEIFTTRKLLQIILFLTVMVGLQAVKKFGG